MTILVVEDDKNINEVVSEYLKEAGMDVISELDGRTASDLLSENREIDLFILDIMLPGLSGLELLRSVRSNDVYKEKPVMMLTAIQDEYTQIQSFDGLADDYVTKPFSPRILVKRVSALLRRSGQLKEALEAGPISINLESYEAYEQGEKIPLTLREYELLKTLMQNPTRVLSRQQLLDTVWGYDYFGDERIVDVHIKNMRKKIRAHVIDTVKGVGYRLRDLGKEEPST